MSGGEKLAPASTALDHLILGAADLDRGIEWVESLTGVKAVIGGRHPGAGTRNALISLGGRRYLEILAPDPRQTVYSSPMDVRSLTTPRLFTWAAATTDIEEVAKRARGGGHEVLGPVDGSRARPDGRLLQWKTLRLRSESRAQDIQAIPFFIEWAAGSLHPSQDSPTGCELEWLEFEHPDPGRVTVVLTKLGIEAKVRQAGQPRLIAGLKTPKGSVEVG